MEAAPVNASIERIAQRLRDNDITRVAVVDDAYDPPTTAGFAPSDLEQFWATIEHNAGARQELQHLGLQVAATEDITDQVLQSLWNRRSDLVALREVCENQLFVGKIGDLNSLDILRGHLESLGCIVDRLGVADVENYSDTSARLVFVDYYLGPLGAPPSVDKAVEVAKAISNKYPTSERPPLFILMSSIAEVEAHKDEFRDKSELLGGMFYFSSKADLSAADGLLLRLGIWMQLLPFGHTIQQFVSAIAQSLIDTTHSFLSDIRRLSVGDYAFIQKLSLQSDGHPLGDYMVWLYGAYYGHLLFSANPALRKHIDDLDHMNFERLPQNQTMPSLQLTRIYESAIFDATVGDVPVHPLAPTPNDGAVQQLLVNLGDIFAKDDSEEVWMIISAQCDLAFSPVNKGRQFDPERSVVLLPGRLYRLGQSIAKEEIRTELFTFRGQSYRIVWDTRRSTAIPHGKLEEWKQTGQFTRVARLRLPYALQVQGAFAADLTRVGMPVAPPLYQPVMLELIAKRSKDESAVVIPPVENMGFLTLTRDGTEKFFFTVHFAESIRRQITQLIEEFQARRTATGIDNNELSKIDSKIGLLTSYKDRFEEWYLAFEGIELKAQRAATLENKCLGAIRNPAQDQIVGLDYLLVISVTDIPDNP